MDLHLTVQGVILIVMLILNIMGVTFAAGKIVEKLRSINDSLVRLDSELSKRDAQISALWKRLDEVRDMIPVRSPS